MKTPTKQTAIIFAALLTLLLSACSSTHKKHFVSTSKGDDTDILIDFSNLSLFEYTEPDELERQSYVVAKGRFSAEPFIYETSDQPEEGVSVAHLAWRFTPNEIYRDVRSPKSEGKRSAEALGYIWVTFNGNMIKDLRGDEPFESFVQSFNSEANLNSVITDRDVYVFLAPGLVSPSAAEAHPELSNVMVFANTASCYEVDDLSRNCMFVADEPGGPPRARIEHTLAPQQLETSAIEASGDFPEVYDYGIPGQAIDAKRYASAGPVPTAD